MNIGIFFTRLFSLGGLFVIINALYYVYQIVLNHWLPVSLYGNMSSLIAWTVLASIPSIALSTFLTRYITLYRGDSIKRRSFIHTIFVLVLKSIVYGAPILFCLGWWIAPYMKLSILEYVMIILTVIVTIFVWFFRSIAYVDGRLKLYTISTLFEVGIRIFFTYCALYFIQDISILYGIYFLSIVCTLWFFVPDIRDIFSGWTMWQFSRHEVNDMKKSIFPMIFFSCFLISIGSTELVLARQIASSEELGYFSALIMLSKLVIAGLWIWTAVGVPYFSDTSKQKHMLMWVYAGFVVTALSAYIVFYNWRWLIVDIVFSHGYDAILPYVLPMIGYAIIVSGMWLMIQHAVIAWKYVAWYMSLCIPIMVIILFLFTKNDIWSLVWTTFFGYALGSVIWIVWFAWYSVISYIIPRRWSSGE